MMGKRLGLTFLLLSCSTTALAQSYGNCVDLTLPVTATAENSVWAFPPLKNGYEATYLFDLISQRDGNASALVAGKANITETFSISAQYCTPTKKSTKSQIVQILTHGLGFEKSYWNFTLVPGDYSYTESALAAGYSTFSYDRIGTGFSSYADPYNVIQAPMELAILIELTKIVWSGSIQGLQPSQVVHVGHSYGSVLSHKLAAVAPSLSNAVILTGYSTNTSWLPLWLAADGGHLASENQPARFANYSTGFITWGDKYYNQYGFFSYPYFDLAVLEVGEAHKQPYTVGELLTIGALNYFAAGFQGPVLFLTGQRDLIFCGYDCTGSGPFDAAQMLFPSASAFEVYLHPNVGHGINLQYNATAAHKVGFDFLAKNGLC